MKFYLKPILDIFNGIKKISNEILIGAYFDQINLNPLNKLN